MKNIIYILVAVLLIPSMGLGQQNLVSGQNIQQYRDLEWKHVATDHFDVHYSTPDPSFAAMVARYAEEGLWDICQLLDYKNRSRYSIYLFMSPAELAQSNMSPDRVVKDAGITPIRNNTAKIVFPGTMRETQKDVKSEVARMLIEDYYFGGGIQKTIQNSVLLHLPDWYLQGFSAYLGEGWSYEDEMWLSGLENMVMTDYALEDNLPINDFARKSIWYYIASNYGEDKLSEIFYMTRLTRSVEDGMIHVLGITLKTLTERWWEFALQRISTNKTFRVENSDAGKEVRLDKGQQLLGYSLNPKTREIALLVQQEGRQKLLLRDLENGIDLETSVQGGEYTRQYDPYHIDLPVAFSPDGQYIALVIYREGEEVVAFYNVESKEVKYSPYRRQLDKITQFSWSSDSKQLVCSALSSGSLNLFRFGIGASGFTPLVEDPYENIHPVWSQDDQRIYFASNRPNDSITDAEFRFDSYASAYDLWELSLEDNSLRRVTQTPLSDEFPVQATSSFEILIRTNTNGIYNLQTQNVFAGDSTFHTNFNQGIYSADYTEREMAFLYPSQGGMALYTAKKEEIDSEDYVVNTFLKNATVKEIRKQMEAAAKKAIQDSLNNLPATNTDPDAQAKDEKPKDSKVKYYVFDEDDSSVRADRKKFKRRKNLAKKEKPVKPDFNEIEVKSPARTKRRWSADRITTQLGYDPIFRINLLIEARIRDHQGDYELTFGFRPYWDLKSSDTYLNFVNRKHKTDFALGLERTSRYLYRNGFSSRYNATKLYGKAVRPLNRYLSVSGGLHTSLVNRFNIELIVPKDIDNRDLFVGGHLNLTYDKREWAENFVKEGTFARVDVSDVYSTGNLRNEFLTASLDIRKYIPVRKAVLAGRLIGGWSQGINTQRFFLGGTDDWLFGQFFNTSDFPFERNLSDFHYMQYITPVRGFQFNARNGSKYVFANAELRLPVGRMFRSVLNSNPLYNVEIIPFFDFGTAWDEGNPLSQRNPIDTETLNAYPLSITVQTLKSPFVMGFGAGLRTMVLGYNIRADLGWGVEDYSLLRPRLHLSLGKNF